MLTFLAQVCLLYDEVSIVFLIAYIGPETISPILSVVAAIGGAAMMAGRSSFGVFQRVASWLQPWRNKAATAHDTPRDE